MPTNQEQFSRLLSAAYLVATGPSVAAYRSETSSTHGVHRSSLTELLEALRPFVPDRLLPELTTRLKAGEAGEAKAAEWRANHR